MLEQSAVHMTEEEIDAYYRQQQEENLKRYYAIQANRAIQEDRGRLIRLVIVTVAALVVCTIFLKLNFLNAETTVSKAKLGLLFFSLKWPRRNLLTPLQINQ